jgi:WD40 repeat protein
LKKELATLKGHDGIVNSVSFSPDGKYLASGSNDGMIKLWSF